MIKNNLIDNNTFYCGCQIGTSLISKRIQAHSESDLKWCPEFIRPNKNNISSHTFVLFNNTVYQSHAVFKVGKTTYRGVHKLPFADWLKASDPDADFFLYPHNFDLKKLEYWVKNNPGYGGKTIAQLLIRSNLTNLEWTKFLNTPLSGSRDIDPGLICSEYAGECENDKSDLVNYFKLPGNWCLKPIHWHIWGILFNADKAISKKQLLKTK